MDKSDCIDPTRYLDGKMDCRDGSDERTFQNLVEKVCRKFVRTAEVLTPASYNF